MIDLQTPILTLYAQQQEVRDEIGHLLLPEFFTGQNRVLFEAMSECGNLLAPVSLKRRLETKGVKPIEYGGDAMVKALFNMPLIECGPLMLREYVSSLADDAMNRRLIQLGDDLRNHELSITRRMERAGEILSFSMPSDDLPPLQACLNSLFNPGTVAAHTEIQAIDEHIIHLEGGDVLVLAGNSSIGKTAMALNMARKNVNKKKKVGIFSMEMKAHLLLGRMLGAQLRIPGKRMRRQEFTTNDRERMTAVTERWAPYLKINDTARTDREILKSIRRMAKTGIKLIIIDYLQLAQVVGSKGNKNDDVSKFSRALKEIAVELNIAIIELSQLNRENVKRDRKKPQMSDLRDSGAVEQDADFVMFLYYESYFAQEGSLKEEIDVTVIIAKGRNTGIAEVPTKFNRLYGQFDENSLDLNEQLGLPLADSGQWPDTSTPPPAAPTQGLDPIDDNPPF